MQASVSKSRISGTINAPPSKSYTIRGLMCAALTQGESEITHPLAADDTDAAVRVLTEIGTGISRMKDGWRVTGGHFRTPDADLCCGDSAATLRFMTAVASLVPGECRLTAGPSLARRPVKELVAALQQLGVRCAAPGGLPPVTVTGVSLKGGFTAIPGDVSSQFVSALLLVSPLAEETVTISLTTPLESKSYVSMTLECLQQFGIEVKYAADMNRFTVSPQVYRPAQYTVEGDWSSASYFLALGALAGETTVQNLNPRSLQGDKVLLDYLTQMGAEVNYNGQVVTVRKGKLKALRADLNECIDLLPTIAILAAAAEGTSELTGISRARLKESDRVAALREGLVRLGVPVIEENDRLVITGSEVKGGLVDSKSDHRIAMAFGVLGCSTGNIMISNAECVNKTFPEFWKSLKEIGGKVELRG